MTDEEEWRCEGQLEFDGMPEKPEPVEVAPTPYEFETMFKMEVDIKVDLSALILEYPDEYRGVDMHGYATYERPMNFLWHHIHDMVSPIILGPHIQEGFFDDLTIDDGYRWKPDMFEALAQVCSLVAEMRDVDNG